MPRRLILVLALVMAGCSWIPFPPNPQPTPTPEPPDLCEGVVCECGECSEGVCPECPPEPPPDPHVPKCNQDPDNLKCDCWTKGPNTNYEWLYLLCQQPPFDFAECETHYTSGVCLAGTPEMGIYWYQASTVDFTPKLKYADR